MSEIQLRCKRAGNIGLSLFHRSVQAEALRKIGRDGAGQSASGAMRIRIVDPLAVEPAETAVAVEQIVRVVEIVAALHQDRAVIRVGNQLRRGDHVVRGADLHAGKDLALGNVRGEDGGHGKQIFLQGADSIVRDQLCAAGRHHDGVDDDVFRLEFSEFFRDALNDPSRCDHADLHRVRTDVRENAGDLLLDKLGRDLKNSLHAGGVLGCQGCDGAHAVHAVRHHGLQICLDTGASAGIASGDRQCCLHLFSFRDYSLAFCPGPVFHAADAPAPQLLSASAALPMHPRS